MKPIEPDICELCKRQLSLSFHHLIPKKMHDKRQVKAMHQDIDLVNHGIWVCNDCHKHIHKFIGHEDLAYSYYSKDRLLQHEKHQCRYGHAFLHQQGI